MEKSKMKETYFIYRDKKAVERQSDGVEFCKIPEFYDNKIYFYCAEYMIFWTSIEDIGDLSKAKNFKLKNKIIPVTLKEICSNGLVDYINFIKQYDIQNKKFVDVTYIRL